MNVDETAPLLQSLTPVPMARVSNLKVFVDLVKDSIPGLYLRQMHLTAN